jgi:hypothetical protein
LYAVDGYMKPSATRYQRPCWPRFWQSAESLGHCWATNHTIIQWLRLHTHPKLLAHQCVTHIRCLNHFICSGRAYKNIGNPLPSPLLTQILTVDWKLGSMLGYKPYQHAVVEAQYPSKAACTSMRSTYKVFAPIFMQGTGIWNHPQPVTIALVDPDFDSRLKAWFTAGLQTIPLCSGWGSIPIQSCLHINVEHM